VPLDQIRFEPQDQLDHLAPLAEIHHNLASKFQARYQTQVSCRPALTGRSNGLDPARAILKSVGGVLANTA
jgi:hypothetical protein